MQKSSNTSLINGVAVKKCKQCGRKLNIVSFRKYPYRGGKGAKTYSGTSQGTYTICTECEAVERLAMRLLKRLRSGEVTDELNKQIEDVSNHYKKLTRIGLPPVTANARRIVDPTQCADSSVDNANNAKKPFSVNLTFVDYTVAADGAAVTGQSFVGQDTLMDEFNKLMVMDLTDNPEVYDEILYELRDKMQSNQRDPRILNPVYESIYNSVLIRIDNYGDEYWKTH